MAKVTYLVLPCSLMHHTDRSKDVPEIYAVQESVKIALAKRHPLGVQELEVEVEPIVGLSFGTNATSGPMGCGRHLLRVRVIHSRRVVRLKWCYYPMGAKYDLVYRGPREPIQLVLRAVVTSGEKVKTIRAWKPSINLADLIGWGVPREYREQLFYAMLAQPSCPDPAVHNWLVVGGGRVERIDANQQSSFSFPQGRDYLEFLRLSVCVGDGQRWKQVWEHNKLIHVTKDGNFKFADTRLLRLVGSDQYRPVEYTDHRAGECFDTVGGCQECLQHPFRVLKMVFHNNATRPPESCRRCHQCQAERLLGRPGTPQTKVYVGCTDVEGVGENSVDRPAFCYDSQERPIPRPSTPAQRLSLY
eukprot:TRINITY_DN17476_c0_g1_i2.p1 TRINITY_DN17476_c0_g1~~TRINITY_DN17476_c0_g1_i2.p1  ORF type:complete len:359 (+),score=32.46 TRINITY_DN17476_c0_g1_i2:630-1706(+)